MSSTKCHIRLSQVSTFRKVRKHKHSGNLSQRWRPSEPDYLLLGEAHSLAEFLLQAQPPLTSANLEDAPASHKRCPALLGFANLGHFLDWLDAKQNAEKTV